MQEMTDRLALDSSNKKSKKQIWNEVRKIADPFIEANTPYHGLDERQVNNRYVLIRTFIVCFFYTSKFVVPNLGLPKWEESRIRVQMPWGKQKPIMVMKVRGEQVYFSTHLALLIVKQERLNIWWCSVLLLSWTFSCQGTWVYDCSFQFDMNQTQVSLFSSRCILMAPSLASLLPSISVSSLWYLPTGKISTSHAHGSYSQGKLKLVIWRLYHGLVGAYLSDANQMRVSLVWILR